MTRSPRRVAPQRRALTGSPVQAAIAGALVLATLVGLGLTGGYATSPTGPDTAAGVVSAAQARQVVCPGHAAMATAQGTAAMGRRPVSVRTSGKAIALGAGETARLAPAGLDSRVIRTHSPTFVAGQLTGGSAVLTSCVEAASSWWFAGLGATPQHSSQIVLVNPRPGVAIADVVVNGRKGPIDAPGLRGISVAAGAEVVIDLASATAAKGDLAAQVTTSRGLVAAAAVDAVTLPGTQPAPAIYWTPASAAPAKQSWLIGTPPASAKGTLTLVLANTGPSEAVAAIKVAGSTGTFAPQGAEPIRVPAGRTISVAVPGPDDDTMGYVVSSRVPLLAAVRWVGEKSAVTVPTVPLYGGKAALPVDPATATSLLLTATEADAEAKVISLNATGRVLSSQKVQVAAQATLAVALPEGTAAVVLTPAGNQAAGAGLNAVVSSRLDDVWAISPLAHPNPQRAAISVRPR